MRAGRHHAVAVALSLLAAALVTWPLVTQLASAGPGEKFLDTYYIGRFLIQAPLSTWLSPELSQLNYPDSGSAVLVSLPQFLVARVLDWVMPVNAALNLSFLLHLAAGIYGGYRLAWRVWGPAAPGGLGDFAPLMASGLALGASAHALSVFAMGQPENFGVVYMTLAAEGGWLLVRERRWGGLALMLAAASAAFTSSPYLMMALLLAAWPFGLWALARDRSAHSLVGGGALALVCLGWTVHYTPASEGTDGRLLCPAVISDAPDPARVFAIGEDPLSKLFTYPEVDHDVLVTDPVRLLRPGRVQPKSLQFYGGFLGFALLGLAVYGLRVMPRFARRALLLSAAGPLLLSLGNSLVVFGWIPTWGGGRLRLPLEGLQALPGLGRVFETIQVPERLILGGVMALALALPPGLRALEPRLPEARLIGLIAALPYLEQLLLGPVAPPIPLFPYDPPDAYEALAEQAEAGAVVDLPPIGWSPDRAALVGPDGAPAPPPLTWIRVLVRGAATHGRPVPYGGCVVGDTVFHPSAQESALARELGELLSGHGGERDLSPSARQLSAQGYRWLVFHPNTGLMRPDQEATALRVLRRSLQEVHAGADGTVLFRLP